MSHFVAAQRQNGLYVYRNYQHYPNHDDNYPVTSSESDHEDEIAEKDEKKMQHRLLKEELLFSASHSNNSNNNGFETRQKLLSMGFDSKHIDSHSSVSDLGNKE